MSRWFLFAALLTTAACQKIPTREQCQKLVAHLVDLEIEAAKGSPEDRAKIVASLGERSLDHCMKEMPLDRIECGLRAKSTAEAASCDQSSP